MKNLSIYILIIIAVIIIAGLAIFYFNRDNVPPQTYSKCISDDECVLKPKPVCCGETLEFINSCYHKNDIPEESTDCKGNNACAGYVLIEKCGCIESSCAPVFNN